MVINESSLAMKRPIPCSGESLEDIGNASAHIEPQGSVLVAPYSRSLNFLAEIYFLSITETFHGTELSEKLIFLNPREYH